MINMKFVEVCDVQTSLSTYNEDFRKKWSISMPTGGDECILIGLKH